MAYGAAALPPAVREVLRLWNSTETLLGVLSQLSGRPVGELEAELCEHLAVRIGFLLLGDLASATNFGVLEKRLGERLDLGEEPARRLAQFLACSASQIDSWTEGPRRTLADLPYPLRQRMLRRQGNRCGVCGWPFSRATSVERSPA